LINLVIVGDYIKNKQYGGAGEHIRSLSAMLANMNDINVHVVTLGDSNCIIKENKVEVHVVKRRENIYRDFTLVCDAANLKKEIERINPDIVHIDGAYIPYNYLISIICNEYPMLVTLHGFALEDLRYIKFRQILSASINYVLERLIIPKISNISVCSVVLEQSIKRMTDERIFVIPNGFNFNLIKDIENVDKGSIVHPSILYIGRLEKIKGIEILIRAIPEIKKKLPNIHAYIAGEGSEKNAIKKLAKQLKIENCITLLGFISGYEKYFYIKAVDLVVVPSYYESFGIALLEAMSCAKPIVASNAGNIPNLIEDGVSGILFEPGNYGDLAAKSIGVLAEPMLGETMGINARKEAQKYTWENSARLTFEAYKKILGLGEDLPCNNYNSDFT
jgi:glycosyltransferase involved in cell wall biosynthesis